MGAQASGKNARMPQDPAQLVDAITVAVREGDDQRIGLLLDRLKYVAELPDLIRLRYRLGGASLPMRARRESLS
ncbi:hypothetical protein [Streptomyces sp. NBC_01276]|uniref:hypothetical protein n=1 Tax=Streptomyces sp. NBC_01276 TaxID=2903808 RepID=UPI00352FCFA2